MSLFINTNNGPIYTDCTVTVNYSNGQNNTSVHPRAEQAEEVQPIDTSFFCRNRFTEDIIEKNLREAIEKAKSKAVACRNIMMLDTLGYILLSNKTDEEKAKLINPFAAPTYTFTGEDFKKARNRQTD